ncbi:MAG: tetratricopeptide repeat protein [Candidatus Omnitrophota bacterium]|nr:tetratricopeptide repeat protein [Candidatus Omnitrophota bacterium]MDZ4241468.1 tetratricopeptide repeat protein [Candidatus Omnitrophota bacterium]
MKKLSSILKNPRLKAWEGPLAACLIALLGWLAYRGGMSADFQFDDYVRIADNPVIKHLNLGYLWDYDPARFLSNLTFALNFAAAQFRLFSWHVVSLLVHIVNAVLVYRLTALTMRAPLLKERFSPADGSRVALFTSLIFLLHPLQTQSVIYLVQRSTLLSGTWTLLSLYLFTRGRLTDNSQDYFKSFLAAVLGIITRPSFITLPLAVLVYHLCFWGLQKRGDWKIRVTFSALCVLMLAVPFLGRSAWAIDFVAGLVHTDFQSRFWTQGNVFLLGWRLLLWPAGLNLDHDIPAARHFWDFPTPLSFAAIGAALFLAFRVRTSHRWLTFAVLWFFVSLGGYPGFAPIEDFFFEHWLYLSCFGFGLAVSCAVVKTIRSRTWAVAVLTAWVACFGVLTVQRSALWSDPIALLTDVTDKSPEKVRTHNNLGLAYLKRGMYPEAERSFLKAVSMDPEYYSAYNNLALIYLDMRKFPEARVVLDRIIRLKPDAYIPYLNMARLFREQGQWGPAQQFYEKAKALNSNDPNVRMGLGNIYADTGRLELAKVEMEAAVWLNPENARGYYNLGNINYALGNFYDALNNYNEALRLQPGFVDAMNNLGHIYYYFQDFHKAKEFYARAVRTNPAEPKSFLHLANVLVEMGEVEESRRVIRSAIQLYRDRGDAEKAGAIQQKLDALPL